MLHEWKKKQKYWNDPTRKELAIKVDGFDVSSVGDVANVDPGEPLFSKFTFEDWALLRIRLEIQLLMHGFKNGLVDPHRPTFLAKHFACYYNTCFEKQFNINNYGFKKLSELAEVIKDVVEIKGAEECLEPLLADTADFAQFVELTEAHRRDRTRCVDAGDESALLRFARFA